MTARIAILADDLIWSSRLIDLVRGAGAEPVAVRSQTALVAALPEIDGVIIDLTARTYDGIEAATVALDSRKPSFAVGQHDDAALRSRALKAGAVFAPYRRLTGDGVDLVQMWVSAVFSEEPT